jgi:hypothetical protein
VATERIADQSPDAEIFATLYGRDDNKDHPEKWRRIDHEWIDAAESLAIRLNDEVNNTSAVVAIELPRTGRVLLFTGDAQRGSWVSWSELNWTVGGKSISARDLLSRTVFYKVGHHGSHNATLKGHSTDNFANLDWLGQGEFAREFVAMIPANKIWAEKKTPRPWKHPLKAIEDELLHKADGRVFRMDQTGLPSRPPKVSEAVWTKFTDRADANSLYFQYEIRDD